MNLIKIDNTTSDEFNEALKILNYSFPKDKMPEWGTNNLKIKKEEGGWSLVNYLTPILFRNDEGQVFFNTQKYSMSTTTIQNSMRRTMEEAGVNFSEVDESGMDDARFESVDKSRAQSEGEETGASKISKKAFKKISTLMRKAEKLGEYDFDVHQGKTWEMEACDDGQKKLVRK